MEALFFRYRQRHIAFQIQYEGLKYYGFAAQDGGSDTVENHFFNALEKLNLITNRKVSVINFITYPYIYDVVSISLGMWI
jgi:hypothetical protein